MDSRLHDARHTAATVLLILQVHERAGMGVMRMGHHEDDGRYRHMIDSIRATSPSVVGGLVWTPATRRWLNQRRTSAGFKDHLTTSRDHSCVRVDPRGGRPLRLCWSGGGGYEIRTREGVNPTRFPSLLPAVRP